MDYELRSCLISGFRPRHPQHKKCTFCDKHCVLPVNYSLHSPFDRAISKSTHSSLHKAQYCVEFCTPGFCTGIQRLFGGNVQLYKLYTILFSVLIHLTVTSR